ncbi:relaxin-3 [Xiphophorus maculatus]|uniref:Relaxin-3 n=1 Tax=Xiphophorus maculatus TaxID=8083 RepID=A0A3B5QHY0_XIPMA|nr:relaxin-3 [Xiphophorus maculatus]XP_027884704.1 insulin-like peptide INSL5 [Xiphophorus couchianus]XP_032427203.1 insulin-like peptide INSL5 [Xiphophorus hellerii]
MQKIAEGVAGCERLLKNTRKKKKTTEHLRGVWKSSSMRLLAVLALLFCVVVCVDQARAEMQAVKLCGREFLRAVVYTCGGSRWKRFFSEPDMGGLSAGEQNSLENLSIPGSNWSKRDINNILTNLCCQVGCRKSELTYLC